MPSDCPCENEKPDPCPKCGATVSGEDPVHGVCQVGKQFDEILRLKSIIRRARLAVTVLGLNQARRILNECS